MQTKFLLSEDQIPKQWYNIIPDMPGPLAPVINPRTMQPVTPDDLLPIFPMSLIGQEVSRERWITIPEEVREIYKLWRPAPLFRAHR
jgi:tryptophan synthase beta chain